MTNCSNRLLVVAAAAACLGVPAQVFAATDLLLVTDVRYLGSVSTEARRLLDGPAGGFQRLEDYVEADSSVLAGGIEAASLGVGAESLATAAGAAGIGISVAGGGGGVVSITGSARVQGQTSELTPDGDPVTADADASASASVEADFTLSGAGPTVRVFLYWELRAIQPFTENWISGFTTLSLSGPDGSSVVDLNEELEVSGAGNPGNRLGGTGMFLDLPVGDFTVRGQADVQFAEMQGGVADAAEGRFQIQVAVVPLPPAWPAMLAGMAVLAGLRRRPA